MALQRAKLADIQFVSATVAAIYTNPDNTKSFIKGFIVHNTNASTENVEIYVVPHSGTTTGTPAAGNRIFYFAIAANETVFLPLAVDGYPVVLDYANDAIFAKTTTGSKVTVIVCGDKE